MLDPEAEALRRGGAQLAHVVAVRDGGAVQELDAEAVGGQVRAAVEVLQMFGVASRPAPGALALLLAVGGDQGHLVALPIGSPEQRFGGLAEGESVLYGADGSRVVIRQGGVIEVQAGSVVRIAAPGVVVEAPQGVTIVGDVHVTGSITATAAVSDANGSMQEMRDRYNAHQGHGSGGGPSPQMT
ncbi:phage baseplate assembly protein [Pseudoroseomonas cervicalis]|uniref:Bacteriophage Mu Gp45 protein n=1 Tax=Pseudoroseomonas cervicalis ATCC 49957 TaxID=525371 RepID=D5RM88_9PROT|nr:phage baseplate assembly protein [Pseudoroseomonas cervicalis]EFH11581.1 bacteriophage Mu Gp45 protein [Pseudoroseomonas cervicalis ATCC 49957]